MPPAGSTTDAPPIEALDLRESISLLEASSASSVTKPDGTTYELGYDGDGNLKENGVFDAQGRVPLHIIRPGIGKGRGRHLYEADMLEEAASNFAGWKMFLNHLSPEAKKAAAGLPRDIRDTGGLVQEAWWDPNVPANTEAGHGQGAVMAMVRPVKFIRNLIDDEPRLAEASISASATGVRPVTRDGQRVWLVEGIQPRGSVDWVTEAGAGGRIAPMLEEAYADDEDVQMALIESLTDDELLAHLRRSRPGLLEEAKSDPDNDGDDDKGGSDDDKLGEKTAALMKRGMPRAMAEKAARKALSESNDDPEGGDVAEITPEALSEALAASPEVLIKALSESGEAQVFLSSLVEAKIEEERDFFRADAKADVDRAFELARLERTAHSIIAESKLPDSWQADLRARFSLVENAPTDALDVVADVDDDGKTTKTAEQKLRESVEAEINKERERLREASGTRVRSTASALSEAKKSKPKKDGEDDPAEVEESRRTGPKPYWASMLEEAGISDPDKAYASLDG